MATREWLSTSSTDFNTAANWSGTTVPVNSDTIVFSGRGTASCTTNLPSALTGITVNVSKAYTGSIGVLPAGGTAASYFTIDGGTINLEIPTGSTSATGSPLLMFANSGATAMTINVYDSATPSGVYPPILFKGGTGMVINQYGGSIGVAMLPSETATITHNVDKTNATTNPAWVHGSGVTLTALVANSGTGLSLSTLTQTALTLTGTASHRFIGTGATTALTVGTGATCYYNSSGTISGGDISGVFDRTGDNRSLTMTANVYAGASMLLNNGKPGSITRTLTYKGCGLQDLQEISTPIGESL